MVEGVKDTHRYITVEYQDHISTVNLNRPSALNAMNMAMSEELLTVVKQLETDTQVRCVIITGAGEKSFSVGGDLKERGTMSADEKWTHGKNLKEAFNRLDSLPVPVIAAIKGYCLGGGCELALACDVRVIAEDAEIGLPEVKLGAFPGTGGPVRLLRLIHPGKAKELLYTGRRILGAEAVKIGLAEHGVHVSKVMECAETIAREISENGPLGVRALKTLLLQARNCDLSTALALSDILREPLNQTKDYADALKAFSEKRKPVFSGQ